MSLILRVLTSQYLALAFRLYIGGVFIYASLYKINFAAEFAETIANYQVVPYWGVNPLAVVLPWIELLAGLMLVIGVRAKSAAVVLGGLLVIFSAGILVNLLRGSPISCGCFHSIDEQMTWMTLVRDMAWLAMTGHAYVFDRAFRLEGLFRMRLKEIA